MPVRHGQTPARRLHLPESEPLWRAGRGFVIRDWRSGVSAERRHLKKSGKVCGGLPTRRYERSIVRRPLENSRAGICGESASFRLRALRRDQPRHLRFKKGPKAYSRPKSLLFISTMPAARLTTGTVCWAREPRRPKCFKPFVAKCGSRATPIPPRQRRWQNHKLLIPN